MTPSRRPPSRARALGTLRWDDKTIVRLQLWDLAGQERFGNMTREHLAPNRSKQRFKDTGYLQVQYLIQTVLQNLKDRVSFNRRYDMPCRSQIVVEGGAAA